MRWVRGVWQVDPLVIGMVAASFVRELPINYLPSTSTVTMYYYIDYELVFPFTLEFNYTYSPQSGVFDRYYGCI